MNPLVGALVVLIRGYQWFISPLFPAHCRFAPSCSRYAQKALLRHGLLAGSWLAMRRILRCHPWGGCGYDPVPDTAPLVLDLSTLDIDPQVWRRRKARGTSA